MILSVPELDPGHVPDVCIIGSGPAGMTLAIALHEVGKDVLVLEAGERTLSGESQQIYEGEVIGEPYQDLDAARTRFLGGSSNIWTGWCRPLDTIDFEHLDAVPDTEWPISKSDLDPYADATRDILELDGEFERSNETGNFAEIKYLNSPPVRFGEKYVDNFEGNTDKPALCLGANTTGLETADGRVTAAHVRDFDGNAARVEAGVFVLACGGIENSRLLLHFNADTEGRLVPQAKTLGRYWMEHFYTNPGMALMKRPIYERRDFTLTSAHQRDLGVLNCRLRIDPMPERDGRLGALIHDLACRAPTIGAWVYERIGRDLNDCAARIAVAWEQEPLPENRISLSDADSDSLGIPKPVLHWQASPRDWDTLYQSTLAFGEFLARQDLGRLRMEPWLANGERPPEDELRGGCHHMGGTRMSARAGDGIVDADLKVWGQDNLYVAGSSVFPSGGYANPTFTIVQLSLRLADHLSRRL